MSNSFQSMRRARRLLICGILVFCVVASVVAIAFVGSFLVNPFAEFAGSEGFSDLSGESAGQRQRLKTVWPKGVDPATVESVSYQTDWSRDSSSTWYRIRLPGIAATTWQDSVHAEQQNSSQQLRTTNDLEGVIRMITGPPSLRRKTGETPSWWSPPHVPFRATEMMIWYSLPDSGVARATYSAFDEATSLLWIYEYTCQHDRLWKRGELPAGERIAAGN
jgi:hypothetical protein